MKAVYLSIVSACVAGVLTGGVMKLGPNALAERPSGPQILVSGASNRVIDNDGWYTDVELTSYSGELPGYVLGTDWAQPVNADAPYVEYVSNAEPVEKAPAPSTLTVYTHPVKKPAPPKPVQVSYPSVDGDILGGLHDGWPQSEPQVVEISDGFPATTS